MNKKIIFTSVIIIFIIGISSYVIAAGGNNYVFQETTIKNIVNNGINSHGEYVSIIGKLHKENFNVVGIIDDEGNELSFFIKDNKGNYYNGYRYKIEGQIGWSIYNNEYGANIGVLTIERIGGD